jgi:hypothetical protein
MTDALEYFHPEYGVIFAMGGTPKGLGHAARDSFERTRAFLSHALE